MSEAKKERARFIDTARFRINVLKGFHQGAVNHHSEFDALDLAKQITDAEASLRQWIKQNPPEDR